MQCNAYIEKYIYIYIYIYITYMIAILANNNILIADTTHDIHTHLINESS